MHLRAVAFGGGHGRAVRQAELLGGGQLCNGQCACKPWRFGGTCGGAWGGVVAGWAAVQRMTCLQAAAFGGTRRCAGRCCWGRGGHAMNESRWRQKGREGGATNHATMRRCNRQCCPGRGGGATDGRGGCSGVFVFYLHMGMGEIHWREERDPIINRIKDRDIFSGMRYFFSTFFFARVFT
jgi:hypothetical protein